MAKQKIYLDTEKGMDALKADWATRNISRIFLVHGNTYAGSKWETWINALGIKLVHFTDFKPNPDYASVVQGIQLMELEGCDAVVAIGGGSAIDVAKCVKLFCTMPKDKLYLSQSITENEIPLYAIPTTAGTGSESTCFAVIYYEGEKKSIEHRSCIPSMTVLDPDWLAGLPLIQKKATLLDALAHGIESFWSVKATKTSQVPSRKAIRLILENWQEYLFHGSADSRRNIFEAANLAGQAINMTRTTAGHAMCYKLTTLFGLPHGFAVSLCLPALWQYMIWHIDQCADPRGAVYVQKSFEELSILLQCAQKDRNQGAVPVPAWQQGAERLKKLIDQIGIPEMPVFTERELDTLVHSVNVERLKNNPVFLNEKDIATIYTEIGRRQ